MRTMGRKGDERGRKSGAQERQRVRAEMHEGEALLLLVVSSRPLLPSPADETLDLLSLPSDGALDVRLRIRRVGRGVATDRNADHALETLERDGVHLDTAEEVEEEGLELDVGGVRVPEGGSVGRGGGEVEEGDGTRGGLDALEASTKR